MKISALNANIQSFKGKDEIHRDYRPAGVWAGSNDIDSFKNPSNSILIVDDNGDVVGRYTENRFGHSVGYIIARADLYEVRRLIIDSGETEDKNIFEAVIENNQKRKKPLDGIFVRFEQFNTIMHGDERTGLTFYSLEDGRKIMHVTQKGHNFPMPNDIEDMLTAAQRQRRELEKNPKSYLSPSEAAEKLMQIFKIHSNKKQ